MKDEAEGLVWLNDPKWYLWDGGFLVHGRNAGTIPPHQQHSIQIVIALDGRTSIADKSGEWHSGRGIIIRHDVEHAHRGENAHRAAILVDPESFEGLWLRSSLSSDITIVPESRLQPCLDELRTFIERPFESMGRSSGIVCTRCALARRQ